MLFALALASCAMQPHGGVALLRRSQPTAVMTSKERVIPFDVHFLRTAKTALRRALLSGDMPRQLDGDGIACIEALSVVNPTEPDPSTDADLWSGAFELLTPSLEREGVVQRMAAVTITEDGALRLLAALVVGPGAARAEVSASGRANATGDASLVLTWEDLRLSLHTASPDDALLSLCSSSIGGLRREPDEGDGVARWAVADASTLPQLELEQVYLDQDMHILRRSQSAEDPWASTGADADAGRGEFIVLGCVNRNGRRVGPEPLTIHPASE